MLKARFLGGGIILALLAALFLGSGAMASSPVTVDESSSGGNLTLIVGDTLNVVLNQQTGSTGYAWGPVSNSSDPSVLLVMGHQIYTSGLPGTMGTDTWTYSAQKAGGSTIYLEYKRGDNVARSFTLTVHVLPPVPASSNLSIGLTVTGLAGALVFIIWRRLETPKQHYR